MIYSCMNADWHMPSILGAVKLTYGRCRYVRCGAWLEGLEDFDQGMFGLAPGDALALDPQARILLEQVQVGRTHPPL